MEKNEPECKYHSCRRTDDLYKVSIDCDYLPAIYRSRVYNYMKEELGIDNLSRDVWLCGEHYDRLVELITFPGDKVLEAPVIVARN